MGGQNAQGGAAPLPYVRRAGHEARGGVVGGYRYDRIEKPVWSHPGRLAGVPWIPLWIFVGHPYR